MNAQPAFRATAVDHERAVRSARQVIQIESQAVSALASRIDARFTEAVQQLLTSRGRAIVCGMGKSGIIGHKIAATMMSTGTPSFYMHPGEAYHGDLGMVTPEDSFIAISNSGETDEVVKLLPYLASNGNFLIALTGNAQSTLAAAAHVHLDVSVDTEACPLQLAPTSSTTAALAMGDALAVAVMDARGFGPADFARFHPGGSLGRRLLALVEDEMVKPPSPLTAKAPFEEVVDALTRSPLGMVLVNANGGWAIITDGDMRRAIKRDGRLVFDLSASDLMTTEPESVTLGTRMEDALAKMDRRNVNALIVLDSNQLPVGIVKR